MLRRFAPPSRVLVLVSLGVAGIAGCAVEDTSPVDGPEPNEPLGRATSGITVGAAVGSTCSTSTVKGLSDQIIAQANCTSPGAFSQVPTLPNVTMGASVFPYLEKPARDAFVAAANAHPGMNLGINSMLRTIAQQYLLYHWYLNGQCGIGLAAVPGSSNHETGLAFDTSDAAAWKTALAAVGFKYFGAADPVHFDYVGPGATNEKGADVLAFQVLWNRNNPGDKIAEDGAWGPATEARMAASPADGFPMGADCATMSAGPDVTMAIGLDRAVDSFADGASAGVPDLFEGDATSIAVTLKNTGGAAADVTIGVEVDDAFSLDDYLIESDWMNMGAFQTNEANSAPTNPAHGPVGASATLDLHQLSPGESKRVTFPLRALAYSVDQAKTPGVRVFVKEIPGIYSEDAYGGAVTNPTDPQSWNGGRLEIAQGADVYARTRWEWGSDRLEGWQPSDGSTVAVVDGSLELTAKDASAYARGPDTSFAATDAPFLHLRAKRAGGTALARVAFLTDPSQSIVDAPAFNIDLPADGAYHEITIDTSTDARFAGKIHGLVILPSAASLDVDYLRADAGGAPTPNDPLPGDPSSAAKSGGCACGVTTSDASPAPLGLVGLLAVTLSRRRRRRATR